MFIVTCYLQKQGDNAVGHTEKYWATSENVHPSTTAAMKKLISQTIGSIDAVGPCQPLYFFAEVLKTESGHTQRPRLINTASEPTVATGYGAALLRFFFLCTKQQHIPFTTIPMVLSTN